MDLKNKPVTQLHKIQVPFFCSKPLNTITLPVNNTLEEITKTCFVRHFITILLEVEGIF